MALTRRQFTGRAAALAGLAAAAPLMPAFAGRDDRMNILCWEGYNSDTVLGPFRKAHPGVIVKAESGISDPDMIAELHSGAATDWDLINVNQPWARHRLYPEHLIRPLNRDRFLPYFLKMLPEFAGPYPPALANDGNLLGMPQRFGPFCFVVNTDRISRKTAEDQGWNLFLDPGLKGRYGILTYDNWNIIHMCLTAGLAPFKAVEGADLDRFRTVARQIFAGSKLQSDDMTAINAALTKGEIDAYFTGGTYTVSPPRLEGARNIRAITPNSGPVDGKGGVVWVELTSAVNNPDPSSLAEDFLEFVQHPDICKAVAFAEGTYNPIAQMGNPEVMTRFNKDELDAIQWDSLKEERARSLDYQIVTSYDALMQIYSETRRS
jgi:spermidine/putrescine transport system substrate-binding protein